MVRLPLCRFCSNISKIFPTKIIVNQLTTRWHDFADVSSKMKFMKKYIKSLQLFFFSLLVSVFALAQEKEINVDIGTEKNDNFFGQPWVWVVGAAVFILLLVAILRSGNRSTE
jgi:hypothetical protein